MEDLIRYFTNLLILQYKNKPRAKATIEALTRNAFSDTQNNIFPIEVQNAYDLDTATGKQLDVLGKYLGYDRMLPIPVDNTFKYAEYDGSVNPNQGYAEYEGENVTYPYAEYRYSSYDYYPISDDTYRALLKMIASLKGKPLSLGNINDALEVFNGEIYVEEKDKELVYHILPNTFPILDNQDKLDMFFNKYFPTPMGCEISAKRPAKVFNLEAVNGAELDEDFIFTNNEGNSWNPYFTKYFKTKEPVDARGYDNPDANVVITLKFKFTDTRSGLFSAEYGQTNWNYFLSAFISSGSALSISLNQTAYGVTPALSTDTWYWARYRIENGTICLEYSTDGTNYTLLATTSPSPIAPKYMMFGAGASTGSAYGFSGQIDFKNSDCIIDGESVMWI